MSWTEKKSLEEDFNKKERQQTAFNIKGTE